ncbi:TonB-dependent receptor [Chloroherpeton thalassium]|nr:TonB-dependent receptor [Chloroherpeton thalassium]
MNLCYAQNGSIRGRVFDATNNETLGFASVGILKTEKGALSDEDGNYKIEGLKHGLYNLQVSYVGYERKIIYEIRVFETKPTVVDFALKPNANEIDEVVVKPSLFEKSEETPLSSRSLGSMEIERAPGGGRDISRVVNVLPGVASPPASNRNDLSIRGGSPSENRFYVDGFEVSTINHFTTQGSSGGVWGVLDANMIRDMSLITGAFPTFAGNALSSVFDINLKEGNRETNDMQLNLGVIQSGINANGAISEDITYMTSARVADFNLLFSDRPIIPTFYDFVGKVMFNLNDKNRLELLGIGALDKMKINEEESEKTEENLYSLERARKIDQWNYSAGLKWTHFYGSGFTNVYLYENTLSNDILKYQDNDPSKLKIMDYESDETDYKLRVENKLNRFGFNLGFGGAYELGKYSVESEHYRVNSNGYEFIDLNSSLTVNKYAVFANVAKQLMDEKLGVNVGFRMDANDYSEAFSNPLEQFSPRVNLTYQLSPSLRASFNSGIYYENPSYTMMGYTVAGELVNQSALKPIRSTHVIAGMEYLTDINSSFSVEGFYKRYSDYPFSLTDGISMANKGSGFGIFGAEEVSSASKGRSYGVEFLYQQKLYHGFYGIFSYTFVKSEFDNGDGNYVPSAWDYGNIVNFTIGKQFGNNWEVGAKFLYNGGTPYTPYDVAASSKIENWEKRGSGILDYSLLNTERSEPFYELDIRIDKKFYFEKWNLNIYLDIRNVLNYQDGNVPELILVRDSNNEPIVDSNDSESYQTKVSTIKSFGIQPNFGIIIEL